MFPVHFFYLELPYFALVENFIEYIKIYKESNEHGYNRGRQWRDIVSGPFPVKGATYANNFLIFEISGQN